MPGATSTTLGGLKAVAPPMLPDEYYQLLSASNGGEGPLPVDPVYFVLDSAETASDPKMIALYKQMAPGLFVFGGNGAGELFAFDLRGASAPWPIVYFDGIDPDGSVKCIAGSFAEFVSLIGKEERASEDKFETLLETAMAALKIKQENLSRDYSLGDMGRWWLDQETATIQFFDEHDQLTVEAQVISIGSFAPKHSSWMWAWTNPTVPAELRQKALPLKDLQAITGVDLFAFDQAFTLEGEAMAWELAAFAVHHLNALGCYRAPSPPDGPTIFLAITNLTRVLH